MENKDRRILYYIVGIIVIIVIVILLSGKKNATPVYDGNQKVSDVTTNEVVPTEDKTEGSVNTNSQAVSFSYEQALAKYENARIQINDTCQAFPKSATYKNGSSIMIDNRSAVAHTLKVGSVFTVKSYGFKIIQLSSAKLPVTWLVDCDKSQNVATVLIQK